MSKKNGKIPKWREDFPIEQEGDEHIVRRDFLRFLTVVSAGFVVGNGYVLSRAMQHEDIPHEPLDLGQVGDLQPGNWQVFHYPDEETGAILIRRENGEYIAFHQSCTHLACPVAYEKSDEHGGERLACHCHNAEFNIDNGKGVKGPPRELRPLRQVILEVRDGRVFAVGLEARHGTRKA